MLVRQGPTVHTAITVPTGMPGQIGMRAVERAWVAYSRLTLEESRARHRALESTVENILQDITICTRSVTAPQVDAGHAEHEMA